MFLWLRMLKPRSFTLEELLASGTAWLGRPSVSRHGPAPSGAHAGWLLLSRARRALRHLRTCMPCLTGVQCTLYMHMC